MIPKLFDEIRRKCLMKHSICRYEKNATYVNSMVFHKFRYHGILLPKLFSPTVRKKCSRDREKFLKFEAEGQEFAKIF